MIFNDLISPQIIIDMLGNEYEIQFFDEIGSTNTFVKDNLSLLKDRHIVIADMQTSGKGRQQRAFFSPKSTGLYLSILLKRDFADDFASYITSAVAVAVCRAIEGCTGFKPEIKWPNDILVNEKKVCGILTESTIKGGKVGSVIIGIGVNVYRPLNGFPVELENLSGYLLNEPIDGIRNRLAAEIIRNVFELSKDPSSPDITADYSMRDSLKGKAVILNNTEEVFAEGIDARRRLVVTSKTGETKYISSGEISIKIINDT